MHGLISSGAMIYVWQVCDGKVSWWNVQSYFDLVSLNNLNLKYADSWIFGLEIPKDVKVTTRVNQTTFFKRKL